MTATVCRIHVTGACPLTPGCKDGECSLSKGAEALTPHDADHWAKAQEVAGSLSPEPGVGEQLQDMMRRYQARQAVEADFDTTDVNQAMRERREAAMQELLPNPKDETPSMLMTAAAQVRQRRDVYGSPLENFQRIAAFWSVYLEHSKFGGALDQPFITPVDVATMMRLVKEARLIESPDHYDSLVDIAGYADCHVECLPKGGEE